MTTEEIIKTIDFFPDDANKPPIEKHFIPVEDITSNLSLLAEKVKEKVKTTSNMMLQQCKDYCQTISESLSKIAIPVAELKGDQKVFELLQKNNASDEAVSRAGGTIIEAGSTPISATKTDSNVSSASERHANHKIGLTKYFVMFLVSELTLLWCSYMIGQHHGMWRYVQAQKEIRYRAKVY